jgi:hypothetical protein
MLGKIVPANIRLSNLFRATLLPAGEIAPD